MKKIIILVFILINFSIFGLDYELDFKKARELSWDKKYTEADKLYKKLLKEFESQEIALSYSNMLSWQGKYMEAVDILNKYVSDIETRNIQLAKIYLWKGDKDKAYDKYIRLKKQGIDIGKQAEEFINEYESQHNIYELKYIYSADLNGDLKEEVPQIYVSYKKDDNLTFVLSREWNLNQNRKQARIRNQAEIYYNSHHMYFGNGTNETFFIGEDFNFEWGMFGIGYTKYENSYRITQVNQKSLSLNNINFTQKITFDFIKENQKNDFEILTSYMSELGYKDWIQYRQYYNFKDENNGNLKIKLKYLNLISYELGLYRDFEKQVNGYNFGIGLYF